jgi:hypothetical protein
MNLKKFFALKVTQKVMFHHEKFNSCSRFNIFFCENAWINRNLEIYDIEEAFEAINAKFTKIK